MITLGFKNILLWRHADAKPLSETKSSDIARPLSSKGHKQAEKMAGWLLKNMPKKTLIISSNAVRATQTAQSLKSEYIVFASLAPSASLDDVLETIGNLSKNHLPCENLLLIGHQPWLGMLASFLLSLPLSHRLDAKETSIKKGAVWWLKQAPPNNSGNFQLHTIQAPSLV